MPPQKTPLIPSFASDTFSDSASSSFGVVNMQRMPSWALQQDQRLVDHVLLVALHLRHVSALDELDHPARVEVDHEADPAAVLAQVLDREPQPARAARADISQSAPFGKDASGSVSQNIS